MSLLLIEKQALDEIQTAIWTLTNELKASAKPNESISLLTVEQIAKYWNMEVQTVRKYLKANKVKKVVFSDKRSLRYRKSDIENFLKSKEL